MDKKRPAKKRDIRRDVAATHDAVKAMQLRAARLPWRDIAAQCGFADGGAAYHAVHRELARIVAENVAELRREELLALDALATRAMHILASASADPELQLKAINSLTRLSESRRRLLGLDVQKDEAPSVQNVLVTYTNDWRPGVPDDRHDNAPATSDNTPRWPVVDAAPQPTPAMPALSEAVTEQPRDDMPPETRALLAQFGLTR